MKYNLSLWPISSEHPNIQHDISVIYIPWIYNIISIWFVWPEDSNL